MPGPALSLSLLKSLINIDNIMTGPDISVHKLVAPDDEVLFTSVRSVLRREMSTETSTKLAFFKELGKCQGHGHGACRLLGSDRLQRFRVRWCVTPYFVSG